MKKTVKKTKKQSVIDYLSTHENGFTVAQGKFLFKTPWVSKVVQSARKSGVDIICELNSKGVHVYKLAPKKGRKK